MDWRTITGWLSDAEGNELARLARGRTCLEIGAYHGRSTVCMALVAELVHSIDPHTGATLTGKPPHDTLGEFMLNIERFGLRSKVLVHVGLSELILPLLKDQTFGLVYVDGNHEEEHAVRDTIHARRLVVPGGVVAVHDYGSSHPQRCGATVAVDTVLRGLVTRVVGSLAVAEFPK